MSVDILALKQALDELRLEVKKLWRAVDQVNLEQETTFRELAENQNQNRLAKNLTPNEIFHGIVKEEEAYAKAHAATLLIRLPRDFGYLPIANESAKSRCLRFCAEVLEQERDIFVSSTDMQMAVKTSKKLRGSDDCIITFKERDLDIRDKLVEANSQLARRSIFLDLHPITRAKRRILGKIVQRAKREGRNVALKRGDHQCRLYLKSEDNQPPRPLSYEDALRVMPSGHPEVRSMANIAYHCLPDKYKSKYSREEIFLI